MYEKIPTAGISREEWLGLRKSGIDGSDAGAVCGFDQYKSIMGVFKDKTCGSTETKDNESMRQERGLEEYVAGRFSEATGLKTRRSNFMYRSNEYPYMVANIDHLVTGEDAGLECKTASAYSADRWKDGDIPLHYLVQCYHYMAVTGKKAWYIVAVILGKDFVYHRLEWDDALISQLRETEGKFWHGNVIKGIMPEPDGSKACDGVLAQYFHNFHTAKKASYIKLSGFDEKLDRREEIAVQIAALQQEQAKIEQDLKNTWVKMKQLQAAGTKFHAGWR